MSKNMKNKNRNGKRKNNRQVTLTPSDALYAQLMGQGKVRHLNKSGLAPIDIHDQTTGRTIADPNQLAKAYTKSGDRMNFEQYVRARSTAGPVEVTLTIRSCADIIGENGVINMIASTNDAIMNPNMSIAIIRNLLEDGNILTDQMVDSILDEVHPAWSQLQWVEDTDIRDDFVKGKSGTRTHSGLVYTEEMAIEEWESKKYRLFRKEGTVTVSVNTDKGPVERKVKIACEKAHTPKGYFVSLALGWSPFRAWCRLSDHRKHPKQIEGRPGDFYVTSRKTPSYIKESKSSDATALRSADAQDRMDALMRGETISF